MLARGIIDSIIDKTTVRVRIPVLNNVDFISGHTVSQDLPEATFCTIPHIDLNLKIGDVVIVGFETNDFTKPIIIGYLYGAAKSCQPASLNLNGLSIQERAQLPQNTQIGAVTPSELSYLSKCESNIQDQLNRALILIEQLQNKVTALEEKIVAIYS